MLHATWAVPSTASALSNGVGSLAPALAGTQDDIGPALAQTRAVHAVAGVLRSLRRSRMRESLPHLLPFICSEEARADFDEARGHVEDGYPSPGPAVPHAEAFFIQVADDAGVGKVLH
jgi:hypothetical protein